MRGLISPACRRGGLGNSQAAGNQTSCRGGKVCYEKRDKVDRASMPGLRNLSVPSWAGHFLTLGGLQPCLTSYFEEGEK